MTIEQRIKELLEQRFEGTDCFWVDVKVSATQNITVFIDCINNIKIDVCAQISRYLEEHLEAESWVGEKYVLEVSSPGMSNSFKVKQQFHKSLGREVKVKTNEGEVFEGILTKTEDDKGFEIEIHTKIKRSKKVEITKKYFLLEDVKSVVKKISFGKKTK